MYAKSWEYIQTYAKRGKNGQFRRHFPWDKAISFAIGMATCAVSFYLGVRTGRNIEARHHEGKCLQTKCGLNWNAATMSGGLTIE